MSISPTEIPEDYPLDKVEVIETPYGKGLISLIDVPAGSPIGQITGKYIVDPDYSSNYCMAYIDGVLEPDEPYRLVNHSCDPNCELAEYQITIEENGEIYYQMWLYSLRSISTGEQLTIDYSWTSDNAIPCLCGSPKCRGWIVDPSELQQLIKERGLGSLEPKAAKKSAAKKSTVKKSSAKKSTEKEDVEKEPSVKKAAVKKSAGKKSAAKKSSSRKSSEKSE